MNIVYLVFGESIVNYQQVCFSIYTTLNKKSNNDKVIIITEDTTFFEHLGDKVEVILVSKQTFKEWASAYDCYFRIKIKALQLLAQKYPTDHILFMDGDTFVYNDFSSIKTGMDNGENFMHLNEGRLSELPTKTEKKMWSSLQGKTFEGVVIDKETCMWNSGLIGISSKNLGYIDVCLEVNDRMCETDVIRKLVEQLAFSVALSKQGAIKPGDHIVGHYWGNKEEWSAIISDFMMRAFMKKWTIDQVLDAVKEMKIKDFPIWVRRSNTQRKLKNVIDNFYKDKRAVFVK
ncbi:MULTISPECIES: hypothetical protein [Myroides]|uniref:hypothetical protein n=1 Tax=Myroides TaxID=76831 RepID=UPI0013031B11|nr:hypothetical protein [Myroides phaeus]